MDEDRYDEIPEDEEELSPEENPPADQPVPIADQRAMLADMQARASESSERPMPADQGETLDELQGQEPVARGQETGPELSIEPPELGDGPLPDFRTAYIPETADLDLPVPPYRQPPREVPSPLRRIPRPQQEMLADMQSRVQRPAPGTSSWSAGKTKFRTKYEPAQQLPADPIFDDDGLTETGFESGQLSETGARNREADAAYRHDVNAILEAHTEMIILHHREIEQLRMALERYRG